MRGEVLSHTPCTSLLSFCLQFIRPAIHHVTIHALTRCALAHRRCGGMRGARGRAC
jgi:hypothetical protein